MTTESLTADCRCMTPPIDYRDYERTQIGCDDARAFFADVTIEKCVHCSRLWLRYYIDSDGHPQSGRWYRGVITPAQAGSVTATGALAILAGLSWHLCGGTYYRSPGARMNFPVDPKYI